MIAAVFDLDLLAGQRVRTFLDVVLAHNGGVQVDARGQREVARAGDQARRSALHLDSAAVEVIDGSGTSDVRLDEIRVVPVAGRVAHLATGLVHLPVGAVHRAGRASP